MTALHVLSAGYARHLRSYFSKKREMLIYLVRVQIEGFCQTTINDITYDIRPGDLLFCKPGDTYELDIRLDGSETSPSADYFLSLAADDPWIAEWWEKVGPGAKAGIGVDEMLIALWKQLVNEKRKMKHADTEMLGYLARGLLTHMKRLIAAGTGLHVYEHSVANRIKQFIEQHATEPFTLQDAASSVELSVSRASQLFREAAGQSIMDYAIEVRLANAKERMLISGSTLQEIAYQCGFSHYTHFNRLFRSRFHMSPSEYNRQLRAKAVSRET